MTDLIIIGILTLTCAGVIAFMAVIMRRVGRIGMFVEHIYYMIEERTRDEEDQG